MGDKQPLQEGRETSTSLNYPKESIEMKEKNPKKDKRKKRGGWGHVPERTRALWEKDDSKLKIMKKKKTLKKKIEDFQYYRI